MADQKIMKEIGQRIRQRRKQLDLTQEQLAEKMEVSVQMISNLEQGKKAIRPENLVKLCLSLSVSADTILLGSKKPPLQDSFLKKYSALSEHHKALLEQIVDSWLE